MVKTVREFFAGVGFVGRGLALWVRSPGLLALGLIPAVISAFILLTGLILLWSQLGGIIDFLTGYADGWEPAGRQVVRFATGAVLVGGSLVVGVLVYTALTLLIGDPFYEKISERIEQACGGVPGEVEESWIRSLLRSLIDSVRLILIAALLGIGLFAAGFIPLVGQTVVPALGAVIGGWFLAVELTGVPFDRRGIRLRERRQILARRRAFTIGYGATIFVLFLIPLGAVLITPAAVAGATLLTREVLGENSRPGVGNDF